MAFAFATYRRRDFGDLFDLSVFVSPDCVAARYVEMYFRIGHGDALLRRALVRAKEVSGMWMDPQERADIAASNRLSR